MQVSTTKVLVLGAAVAAFTFTSFAAEPLLSPRAAGNQIKHVNSSVGTPTITIAYVETTPVLLSPRAAGNQIKVVQGVSNDVNPALVCRNTMIGSPKAVAECSSHTTMPGCMTVATLK
ncbi:MAG TPA: hypothetical protein VMV89_04550 [Candidatus Paceibacterota bacterium]|nr:hypothetical protein [Candidatus Paceibacterota bacterium]